MFQNSTLLEIHSRDELGFMKYNDRFYWVGIIYNEEHHAWVWLNGSAVSQEVFPIDPSTKTEKCISYSSEKRVLDEPCEQENNYICKKQLI